MKHFTLILLAFTALCANLEAQVSKTIHLDTAGTISDFLTADDLNTVNELTVTGKIDASDLSIINWKMRPNLTAIDISGTEIEYYYGNKGTGFDGESAFPANEIPKHAFTQMRVLSSIKLPPAITAIRESAFDWTAISSIDIPSTVSVIEESSFSNCNNLTSIILPQKVTKISDYLFSQCEKLTSVTLSPNTTHIGSYSFNSCRALKEISLPLSVAYINTYSFNVCTGLTTIYAYNPVPVNFADHTWSFYGVGKLVGCTVWVPQGSAASYRNITSWNKIGSIREMVISSIESDKKPKINLYPNPATDGFYITSIEGSASIKIIDMKGQLVFSGTANESQLIPTSFLTNGIYTVVIETANGTVTEKLLKK